MDCEFINCCKDGNFKRAKKLHKLGVDIHTEDEEEFCHSRSHGYLEIAKWLHKLGINIHVMEEDAFRWSCYFRHLEIAKWLYRLNANIHSDNEYAFRTSCERGNLEIVNWLCSIDPNYSYIINEDGKMIHKIKDPLYESLEYDQLLEKLNISGIEPFDGACIICYDVHPYMPLTQCNHILCIECMYYNKDCPYCRQLLVFVGYAKKIKMIDMY
jgi:hypothetical protein